MDILKKLQQEFNIRQEQVDNTVKLIDEGCTIPFIARYRKELTGSLDDQVIREIFERLNYLRNLEDKKQQVKGSIEQQEKLTEELSQAIDKCETMTELEDLYRPYRPKRRTRATIAKEKGLEPLAEMILSQEISEEISKAALDFVCEQNGVNSAEEAIEGAKDIIAEIISDNAENRRFIRSVTFEKGIMASKAAKENEESVYEMYYDFSESVKKIAGHRVLAINRGEEEGFLSVKIEVPTEEILNYLEKITIKDNSYTEDILKAVIEDSYKRLTAPSIERDIRNELTEKAQEGAIKVFSENLKQLLLQPPIKGKRVLAIDPGFRTGCKFAVIDATGKVLYTGVGYFTLEHHNKETAKKQIKDIINNYDVDLISIGNGTASRESELFVADVLKEIEKKIYYIITNEAGASVYSASKLGASEFPDYDVALRSAVSIGRRLQDPLAELVKIDAKSIGVGQYQHDMNQKRLGEALEGVVEDCVNNVGVDLNTASPSLLQYVSGISSAVAKNIVEYRETEGKFTSRKQLLKVKKLGPKAFEQCAGFLRISDGDNIFDNTGVHPESYACAERLLNSLEYTHEDIKKGRLSGLKGKIKDMQKMADSLEVGVPTLTDIIKELEKPGRDPREEMPAPILRNDVLAIEDLKEGMTLKGTVRNVIDFGVFVDIGVHQDGLVHISEICDRYIKHPLEAVNIGDIVKVKILNVDVKKGRISLSMKQAD